MFNVFILFIHLVFIFLAYSDDDKSDKASNRISSTRRKRKQPVVAKSALSESSDEDGGGAANAKPHRSRSQSTEVKRASAVKRGRPRKVPIATVENTEPPKQKAAATETKLMSPSTLKTTPKKESAKRTPVRQRTSRQTSTNSKSRATAASKGGKNPISKGK